VAAAQKDHTYIYDKTGCEINRIRNFPSPFQLDYLLYHMLLVMASKKQIGWLDISLGTLAAQHKVKDTITAMRHNPTNAVMHLAHTNGTVSLWAPNSPEYLVKINCHIGPIHHLAIDMKGNLMATSSANEGIKFWDLRSSYQPLSHLKAHRISGLDFSQRGLFAVATGIQVEVYDSYLNPPFNSQLSHVFCKTNIQSIRFCPFEDVLGVSKLDGFSSLLVPGAGEANFDSSEANPFQSKNQRREATVKRVLDKIPADLITLDPTVVGTVVDNPEEYLEKSKGEEFDKEHPGKITPKYKKRGRSSASKIAAKKEHARMERKRLLHEEERKKIEDEQKEKKQKTFMNALDRFEN
jgi:U3 small nucleolar RNA-associated protein 7